MQFLDMVLIISLQLAVPGTGSRDSWPGSSSALWTLHGTLDPCHAAHPALYSRLGRLSQRMPLPLLAMPQWEALAGDGGQASYCPSLSQHPSYPTECLLGVGMFAFYPSLEQNTTLYTSLISKILKRIIDFPISHSLTKLTLNRKPWYRNTCPHKTVPGLDHG
jgi:hypothetical protein